VHVPTINISTKKSFIPDKEIRYPVKRRLGGLQSC